MSKSHKSERSRILITDSPEEIKAKIGSALTDSIPGVSYDPSTRPGISNLLSILSIFDSHSRTPQQLAEHHYDVSPRQLKEMVSDAVVSGLDGIRDRYRELLDAKNDYLLEVEAEGARRAQKSAQETMKLVKDAMGMSPFS
jgi:tryptophanyl-tRNA synthetase